MGAKPKMIICFSRNRSTLTSIMCVEKSISKISTTAASVSVLSLPVLLIAVSQSVSNCISSLSTS